VTLSESSYLPRCLAVHVLICRYPKVIIGAVLILFLLALTQIVNPYTGELHTRVDISEQALLGPDHEGWEFYQFARRSFGNDETLIVAIDVDDVFSPQSIDLVSRLSARLEKLQGVREVISLANALTIKSTEYGMDIAPAMVKVPESPEEYEVLRSEVMANPLIASALISKENNTTAIIVNLEIAQDQEFFQQLNAEMDVIVKQEARGTPVWITGASRIRLATTEIVLDDLLHFPPLITLVMMVLLWLLIRNIVGGMVPLMTVIVTVVWTVATITAFGYSLNILTALVPPLLMILTLSYSMYVVSDFQLPTQSIHQDTEAETEKALRKISLPVLLAGLTTTVGFSSLYLSELSAIREFGLFCVIGVVYATIITLTFTPSLLVITRGWSQKKTQPQLAHEETEFDRILLRVARFDAEHRNAIFVIAGIVFVISIWGMTQLRVGTEHVTNFKPESEIRQSFEHVNERLNGINPFSIIVQSKYPNAFKQPANLREIEALQRWLESQPEIGGVNSLVDYIKFVNKAFNDNDPAFDKIPDTKKMVGQLLFFTESDDTERLVDSSHRALNIIVRSRVIDSDDVEGLVARVNERLKQLPEHMVARATGNPVLMNQAIQDIMWGQVESVFLTLIIVYGILVSLFLSFRIGLIAIIPNILPVVVYFGALGITGISLNPSTSLIAPMIIGVAIDDTIHYFTRFNNFARQTPDPEKSTIMTLRAVGRPVTYTSLALCVGFLLLTSSDLRMQAQVGAMASFALLVAWLSDFFLTPALCSRLKIATLWDVLTLDLGARPQDTIPLFKGLSSFQTRIVARMAHIQKVMHGERLIEIGQHGKEMYTVIDGNLQASIEGDEGRIELDTLSRGDTFGEAGLFYATRTANVDVVEDARLIIITRENLETLRHRYPRIAAQLFSNLNEILSTRLAHTTGRLK
jgi:predicted RND superfamily exporter protein